MAAISDAVDGYVIPSEQSMDSGSRIVEIDANGGETSLERAGLTEEQKKLLFFLLLLVLLTQASCFCSFQVLNILLVLMQGSASETEQLLAVWGALILLAIAAGTVLSETTIRFITWLFAEANEEQENRLLFLIAFLKTITVSLFCANFYLEEVKTFSPVVAKTGSVFFVGLVLLECLVSGAISAHIPSEKYLSTTFFID
ncbi:MAG: hypothetical protein K0R48_583 [Gammaproteobacteria bacterium]|nr:hypothetical protein [Gammaproteobacteria bacterium]